MGTSKRNNHKKKYNKRKKRRNKFRLVSVFMITLTAVVIFGLGSVLIHKQAKKARLEAIERAEAEYAHFKITKEAIPEDISGEEVAQAVEAAVEEIKQANVKYADEIANEDYLIANNIYVKESKAESGDDVTITFAGDILFDSSYSVMAKLKENGGEIASGIDPALIDIMKASDIMMLNNEFPYSYGGTPTEGKTYTFRADPSTARYLVDMDVDVVSLANNHAYDYGEQAFLDTLSTLDGVGIPYVGAGHNINEASAPVFYIVNNTKIGILSATQIEKGDYPDTKGATEDRPGVFRCWKNKALLDKIEETKQKCDFLIVYIHWGTESTTDIDWAQQEQTPQMVNAGADLIIGDHPHVLQPISVMNGVPIVYSLGNFWFNSKEIDTCMVQATIGESGLKSLKFIPALQSGCRTKLLAGDEAMRVIYEMQSMSPKVSIDGNGYITF